MSPTCPRCGTPLRVGGRGQPMQYCTKACRQAAYRRRRAIPAPMLNAPRWVRHAAKRPITATGRAASVTDPSTWTDYPTAARSTAGHGLGYVLGRGVACIDLDHVLTEGRLEPAAAALLETLPATFTEVSPSGTGLHIFGTLPEAPGRRRTINGVSVETYSTGRYITITGKRWHSSPPVLADLSAALDW